METVKDSQKRPGKRFAGSENKKQNAKGTQEKSAASKSGSEAKAGKKIRWITINEKYMSVCRYVLFVLFIAIVVYMLVSHWSATTAFISNLLKVLSPFILGLLIAYFLLPVVGQDRWFVTKDYERQKTKTYQSTCDADFLYFGAWFYCGYIRFCYSSNGTKYSGINQ